jgi:hypothetical protein
MSDLLFLIATGACFAIAIVYVKACERLKGRPARD